MSDANLGTILKTNTQAKLASEFERQRARERGGAGEFFADLRQQIAYRIRRGEIGEGGVIRVHLKPYEHFRFWSHDDGATYSQPCKNERGEDAVCIHIHDRRHHAYDLWCGLVGWGVQEGLNIRHFSEVGGADYVVVEPDDGKSRATPVHEPGLGLWSLFRQGLRSRAPA